MSPEQDMTASGLIDDLLFSETTARWNVDAPVGAPVTVKFSFPSDQPADVAYPGFSAFSPIEKGAARTALDYISTFTNLHFVETSPSEAQIRFFNADLSSQGASGRSAYPSANGFVNVILSTHLRFIADSSFAPGLNPSEADPGGYAWQGLLHEIGHALGLKHPFEPNINGESILPSALDNRVNTMMSYTDFGHRSVIQSVSTSSGQAFPVTGFDPQTYGVLDIAALQYLYGVNPALAGKVYSFLPTSPVFQTISDSGAGDTVDCTALTGANRIDLTPGASSNLSISGVLATDVPASTIASYASSLYDGTNALTMGFNTLVSNAKGGSGNDTIIGNAAANRLRGNGGDDAIDGGAGIDSADFSGPSSNYAVTLSGQARVRDIVGADGTDTLTSIERLQFTDKLLATDTAGNAGQAYRLYQAAFNRTPDKAGLSYWVNSLDHGSDLASAAASFIGSGEFKAAHGDPATLSASKFLDVLYANILGRSPDPAGKAYWQDQIDHGFARARVLASFSESPENVAIVGSKIVNGIELDPAWMT
jgi:serralysin